MHDDDDDVIRCMHDDDDDVICCMHDDDDDDVIRCMHDDDVICCMHDDDDDDDVIRCVHDDDDDVIRCMHDDDDDDDDVIRCMHDDDDDVIRCMHDDDSCSEEAHTSGLCCILWNFCQSRLAFIIHYPILFFAFLGIYCFHHLLFRQSTIFAEFLHKRWKLSRSSWFQPGYGVTWPGE